MQGKGLQGYFTVALESVFWIRIQQGQWIHNRMEGPNGPQK